MIVILEGMNYLLFDCDGGAVLGDRGNKRLMNAMQVLHGKMCQECTRFETVRVKK